MKESGLNEVELHDDDPAAMVGLLRHLYDLCYGASSQLDDEKRWDSLMPHAEVFVVAEKYQMECLQNEVCSNMRTRLEYSFQNGQFSNLDDFLQALRNIVSHTSDNSYARRLMVRTCVMHLRELQYVPAFISLLQEFGHLGADIIGHEDLECGIPGAWMCSKGCPDDDPPWCSACSRPFDVDHAWASRHSESWYCDHCEERKRPICKICDETFEWMEGRMMR